MIHSGAVVATLLQRNQKKTMRAAEPQNTEIARALSSVSKYAHQERHEREVRAPLEAPPARQRRGQPACGNGEQKPLSLPRNQRSHCTDTAS